MARNGEKNEKFGVYRSVCCGREIVIREGACFPCCPNHHNLSTLWKAIEVGADVIILEETAKAKRESAA